MVLFYTRYMALAQLIARVSACESTCLKNKLHCFLLLGSSPLLSFSWRLTRQVVNSSWSNNLQLEWGNALLPSFMPAQQRNRETSFIFSSLWTLLKSAQKLSRGANCHAKDRSKLPCTVKYCLKDRAVPNNRCCENAANYRDLLRKCGVKQNFLEKLQKPRISMKFVCITFAQYCIVILLISHVFRAPGLDQPGWFGGWHCCTLLASSSSVNKPCVLHHMFVLDVIGLAINCQPPALQVFQERGKVVKVR